MAMDIGTLDATSGMTKAIYDRLEALIRPDLGELAPEDLATIRTSWRKIAFAVATGVIDHLKANLSIQGIETRGSVTLSGATGGTAVPIDVHHQHSVDLTAAGVTFGQVAGTGSVE